MLDVTPDPNNLVSVLVTGVITGVAGFIASRKGGKEGSAGALNGTALAVREIKQMVGKIDTKLDGHVIQTADNFRELSDRTSNIEGRLAVTHTPQTPAAPVVARRPPRKDAMKAKPTTKQPKPATRKRR